MSYQTGTLDITLLNGEQVDQVKDDPEFTSVGAGYLWYISPNIDAVPDLANLNLRKAMTFALDRDAITGDVLKDGSTPAYTAVPAQFAAGPDGSDFSADQTKFADDCAYDPEKAKEFFETAKLSWVRIPSPLIWWWMPTMHPRRWLRSSRSSWRPRWRA